MKKSICILAGLGMAAMASTALAKLPAPSDEAKAKADEAKAKTAWADKVSAYKLCLAQDKVASAYAKKGAAVKTTSAASAPALPPCQDPGAYLSPMASAPASAAARATPSPSNAKVALAKPVGKEPTK